MLPSLPFNSKLSCSLLAPPNRNSLALACFLLHYLKREFETLFVHRFGNSTMPLRNLFKNSSYYWGNAILCSYFINRPGFPSPSPLIIGAGLLLFIVSTPYRLIFLANKEHQVGELGNLQSHLTLRNLRKPGTKERNIPQGGLFQLVSCANYTYEILGWLGFCLMTCSFAACLFTFQGAFQMYFWALAKHRRYRKEFNGENGTTVYPKQRKALVPFLV